MPESSRRTAASLSRALALAGEALATEPAGLLTDFDGTLSPIVLDPSAARLAEGAEIALATLARRLEVVAIITGREPRQARRLVGVPGVLVVGNHGTEWLEPGAGEPAGSEANAAARAAVGEAVRRVGTVPDVAIEHKGLSATLHYRRAPDPDQARRAILAAIGNLPAGVEVREGRMSVELRSVGLGDKGTAARLIIERFGLRGAMVMGDDLTDLDMFGAVATLRAAGRLRAAIVAVGGEDREVPAELTAAADAVVRTPAEVAELLAQLARG